MRHVIENNKKKVTPKPEKVNSPTEADKPIFKAKHSNYFKRELRMDGNFEQVCSVA